MAKAKRTEPSSTVSPMRPALTPEARENQLISLATDLVEKRLRDRHCLVSGDYSLPQACLYES